MQPGEGETGEQFARRILDAQELLATVSRAMGPAVDLSSTLRDVLKAMRELVEFRGGSICLVDDGFVSIAVADPDVSPEVAAASVPVGSGIAGRVALGQVVYSPDLDNDDRVDPELRRLGSNAGMVSYIGVPLISLGEVIGLLQVDAPTANAFDDVDRILLEGLSSQVSSAIAGARQLEDRRRLEEQKTGFIHLVSHELRTPMTISSGLIDVVRQQFADLSANEVVDYLGRASNALERLRKLVEELLLMSRLMGGDLEPHAHEFDVHELLVTLRHNSIDPDLVVLVDSPTVHCTTDANLLERAVAEVIENAVLYAGGCEVSLTERTIVVRDHGPGLPDDVTSADDGTFQRSAQNRSTIAGLGLGLTLARALLGELGGDLELAPADGGGTLVTIELPKG